MDHPATGSCVFSAIIPTYNRARLVCEAIDSALAQDVGPIQIVVIDDGSTDDTQSAIARYGSLVECIRQENRGPAAAKNVGIRSAAGEFVAFLDSDDLWLPGKLRADLELFRELPWADVAVSDCETWLEGKLVSGSWLRQRGLNLGSSRYRRLAELPALWAETRLAATCCISLRRAALQRLGPAPFDETLPAYEDWDFDIRMYLRLNAIVRPNVTALVRRYDDGTRKGRLLPGTHPNPWMDTLGKLYRRQVLDRALTMPDLPAEVIQRMGALLTTLTGKETES
jgi:glycosyltransferase involved in cell wall biosynthesis